jgi:hypothetical protein
VSGRSSAAGGYRVRERLGGAARGVAARHWPALLGGAACVGLTASIWIRPPAALVGIATCVALAVAVAGR